MSKIQNDAMMRCDAISKIASFWHSEETMRCDAISFRNRIIASKRCGSFAPDYSCLVEKDFTSAINQIHCLAELEGLANRRRWLNCAALKKWNTWQREIILRRKWELKNGI